MQMNIKQRGTSLREASGKGEAGQKEPAGVAVGRGWCEGLWSEQGRGSSKGQR